MGPTTTPPPRTAVPSSRMGIMLVLMLVLVCGQSVIAAVPDPTISPHQARKTLVVLGAGATEKTHSGFLASLRSRSDGHGGTMEVVKSKEAAAKSFHFRKWDRWSYDSLVLLAPDLTHLGGEKLAGVVNDFVLSGRSVMLTGSDEMSSEVRDLAKLLGVSFHESFVDGGSKNTRVLDFFQNDGGHAEQILATGYADDAGAILSDAAKKKPLLWSGVGSSLGDDNPLAAGAVRAHSTSFCPTRKGFMSKKKGMGRFVGAEISLVSVVQARNNARAVVTGSIDMLSDASRRPETSNAAVCEDLTDWVLGYKSLLRQRDFSHALVEGQGVPGQTQEVYRIKDKLRVTTRVEEWSAAKQAWLPFGREDLQVEFTMLDPHLRKTFSKDSQVSAKRR